MDLLESASLWVVIPTRVRLPTLESPQTPRKRNHTRRLLLLLLLVNSWVTIKAVHSLHGILSLHEGFLQTLLLHSYHSDGRFFILAGAFVQGIARCEVVRAHSWRTSWGNSTLNTTRYEEVFFFWVGSSGNADSSNTHNCKRNLYTGDWFSACWSISLRLLYTVQQCIVIRLR